jgi:hypothetical protein
MSVFHFVMNLIAGLSLDRELRSLVTESCPSDAFLSQSRRNSAAWFPQQSSQQTNV